MEERNEVVVEMIEASIAGYPAETCTMCKYRKACGEGMTYNCIEGLYDKFKKAYEQERKNIYNV